MKSNITHFFILLTLSTIPMLYSRHDCTGVHYKDKGVIRDNARTDLTFSSQNTCDCPCTGPWTSGAVCIACHHAKKSHKPFIIIKKSSN